MRADREPQRPQGPKDDKPWDTSSRLTLPVVLSNVQNQNLAGGVRLTFDLPESFRSQASELFKQVGKAMHLVILRGR